MWPSENIQTLNEKHNYEAVKKLSFCTLGKNKGFIIFYHFEVELTNWKKIYRRYLIFKIKKIQLLQWIFDLRKFLGTAKNFLKSKIFLKSNILKKWNMQVLAGYKTLAQKIELFSCSIALLFLFRMLSHENKQCFLNSS